MTVKSGILCYVWKQCINIKTMCPNYILEFRNTNSRRVGQYRKCHRNHVC